MVFSSKTFNNLLCDNGTERGQKIIAVLITEGQKALIVTETVNENLELSSRNVPGIKVMRYEGLNVYDILKYEKLILLATSIKGIEGRLTA
jgi:large subunit ribosomal protein L4